MRRTPSYFVSLFLTQLCVEASDILKDLQVKLNNVMDDLSRVFAVRYELAFRLAETSLRASSANACSFKASSRTSRRTSSRWETSWLR